MRCSAATLGAALLACCSPAVAQTLSRPGPWAVDARAVTSPVPEDQAFYPTLDTTARIPGRGLGLDVGAHGYLFDVGPARLGLGANAFYVRATTSPEVETDPGQATDDVAPGQRLRLDLRVIAPQLSFNFGTRSGWSHLSAGAGFADVNVTATDALPGRRTSGRLGALNFGGGARWFLKPHMAFSFDIRFHTIADGTGGTIEQTDPLTGAVRRLDAPPTPGVTILTLGAGLSFR